MIRPAALLCRSNVKAGRARMPESGGARRDGGHYIYARDPSVNKISSIFRLSEKSLAYLYAGHAPAFIVGFVQWDD